MRYSLGASTPEPADGPGNRADSHPRLNRERRREVRRPHQSQAFAGTPRFRHLTRAPEPSGATVRRCGLKNEPHGDKAI